MYKKNGVAVNPKATPPATQAAVDDKFVVYTSNRSIDGVLITPAIAQFLLTNHNGRNRPVKQTRVDQYAMELKLEKWKYNGERILFDKDGQLLSGQHRLLAILKSGVSMLVDLKFGIDPDVRDTIDAGAPRSTKDIRRLVTGDPDSAFKLKALNGVKKILNHRRTGTSAVLAELMENDFSRGLETALATVKNRGGLGRGPAVGAITFVAEAYPIRVRRFVEEVISGGANSHAGKKLASYVMNDFNKDREDDIAAKVLFAIDAFLTGNTSFERLQTGRHEELVEKYLAVIKGNHALETIEVIRPTPEAESTTGV